MPGEPIELADNYRSLPEGARATAKILALHAEGPDR